MIRKCREDDFKVIYEIINDAAQAYKGVIPADRWKEPYMPRQELRHELDDGVVFWCEEEGGVISGVMGIQDAGDVTLIRHAYVRSAQRRKGIGGRLLSFLLEGARKPVLIGTWAAAGWAIRFYEKYEFSLVTEKEKTRLLGTYWHIPERQVETSVVLADRQWRKKNVSTK